MNRWVGGVDGSNIDARLAVWVQFFWNLVHLASTLPAQLPWGEEFKVMLSGASKETGAQVINSSEAKLSSDCSLGQIP